MAIVKTINNPKLTIKAPQIKACLLAKYRFTKQALCATEVMTTHKGGIADFLALIKNKRQCEIHEVEIKVSIADLKADIKKPKWKVTPGRRIPHYFYFAVPAAIANEAKAYISTAHPLAGLIVCEATRHGMCPEDMLLTVKRPTRLHNAKHKRTFTKMANRISKRAMSELATKYRKAYLEK